jgi:hypothetical protein
MYKLCWFNHNPNENWVISRKMEFEEDFYYKKLLQELALYSLWNCRVCFSHVVLVFKQKGRECCEDPELIEVEMPCTYLRN